MVTLRIATRADLDVRALHLEVRPDNRALGLYERHGFVRSRRLPLTKVL